MKKTLFIAMAACAATVCIPVQAQTEQGWTTGAEVAAGDFYLYNTGTKQYLAPGYSSWGTEAWSMPHARKVTLTADGDGYDIDTQISNGGSSNYLASTWMDGAATAWTFAKLEDGAYTLSNSTGYLAATNGASAVLTNASDATTNNEWLLITKDMISSAMSSLTYDGDTYVDATPFITCPDVVCNDLVSFTSSWTLTSGNCTVNSSYKEGCSADGLVEFYNQTYDINQTLTDLPNGTYIVRVQGFYRPGYNGTTETTKNAIFYANESESELMLLSEGSNTSCNNMSDASSAFASGDFSSNSVKVVVTDGTLKIGLKKVNQIDGDWTIFDNFSLEYYGLDLSELKTTLQNRIKACADYDEAVMSSAVKTALDEAKSAGETALNATTESEISSAITALNTALANAAASVEAYATLKSTLDEYAEKAAADLDEDGQTAYTAAVADITTAYTNGTYSTDAATAAVDEVIAAYTNLLRTNSTGDMTGLLVNPDFSDGTNGWTSSASSSNGAWVNNGIVNSASKEVWCASANQLTFDTYQEVTELPAGYYRISADMYNCRAQETDASGTNGAAGLYVQSGDNTSYVGVTEESSTLANYTVLIKVEEGGTLRVGVKNVTTMGAQWFVCDNFTLEYLGTEVETVDDADAQYLINMGSAALFDLGVAPEYVTAAEEAMTAFSSNKTIANYEAAQEAMQDVYANAGKYVSIDETDTYTPAAKEGMTVDLTRTLKTSVWNTLVLPFAVSNEELTALFGSDVKVAEFSNESDETVEFNTMETPSLTANMPVLLKVSDVGESPYRFESRTIVEGTPTLTGAKVNFVGTYEPITDLYNVDTTRDLYIISGNKYYLTTSDYQTEVKGTRAYLSVAQGSSEVKLLIDGVETDATAINGLSSERESLSGTIYTVSGQRVNNVSKGGLYIVNGKKVLVK